METNKCKHENQINDYHEGTVVCLDCSFVTTDQLFIDQCYDVITDSSTCNLDDNVKEILNRLNISYDSLTDPKHTTIENLYNKLNDTNIVTIKELVAASGVSSKKIVKNNKEKVCKMNINMLLEKYCKLMNLTYKNYTVIKEQLNDIPHSGHPPLTIIGYHIYRFMKKESIKVTVKKICKTLGISTVSIQRYKKYELSLRS